MFSVSMQDKEELQNVSSRERNYFKPLVGNCTQRKANANIISKPSRPWVVVDVRK